MSDVVTVLFLVGGGGSGRQLEPRLEGGFAARSGLCFLFRTRSNYALQFILKWTVAIKCMLSYYEKNYIGSKRLNNISSEYPRCLKK